MVAVIERRRRLRRAGRGAHERYELEVKAWRGRNRKFFAVATGIVSVIVVVSIVFFGTRDLAAWIAGLLAGTAVAFLIASRDSPPAWIENYRRGGWGEERTAKALEPLTSRGWTVIHDLRWRGGNLDHVLVGPGGVFVVDTKNWRGEARCANGELWVRTHESQRPTQQSFGRSARGQARELHDWLALRGAERVWVNAVVVVWMEFEQGVAGGSNVTFVHGDRLVRWLDEQPARLSAAKARNIAARLESGQRRVEDRDMLELADGDGRANLVG